MVIEIELNNGEKFIFALQLKHIRRQISQITLVTNNKKFGLKKYIKAFQTVKNKFKESSFTNFRFILFSNSSLEKCEDFDEHWKKLEPIADGTKAEFDVFIKKIDTCFEKELLNTNTTEAGVFIFKSQEDNSPDEEFYKQFYFFTRQKNAKEMESLISDFFIKKIKNCNTNVIMNYLSYFTYWCRMDYGNFKLTKQDIKLKLAELILAPYIPEPNVDKVLYFSEEKALMALNIFFKFDIIYVNDFSDEILDRIWSIVLKQYSAFLDNWSVPVPGFYVSECKKKLPLSALSECFNESTVKKLYITTWHAGCLPLVIKIDSETIDRFDIQLGMKFIKTGRNQVLLISKNKDFDTSQWKVFENFSDLVQLPVFETLLQTLTVSLQGRPTITLQEFFQNDKRFLKSLTTTEFVSMLDETLLIGDDCKKELPKYYISRKIPKILLSCDIIKDLVNDLFVIEINEENQNISNFNKIELNKYLVLKELGYINSYKHFTLSGLKNTENPSNLNGRFYIVTKNPCTIEEFYKICSLNSDKNCHFLRFIDDEKLEWINTCGEIKELQKYQIDLNRFEPEDFVSDSDLVFHFKNPLNIICANPGMGKTTIIQHLKFIYPSMFWIVTVNLNHHVNFFNKQPTASEIIDYFLSREQKAFVKNIIKILTSNKQLIFLWDGFDEISNESIPKIVHVVKTLNQEGYFQWLSARSHLKEFLESTFNTFALTLTQFSAEDQYDFVCSHFVENYQNEEQIKAIVEKINESYLDYTGNPLHINMLTEIYLRQSKHNITVITLTDMYQQFIEGKFETMFERAEADPDNYFMQEIREQYVYTQLNLYEAAAVKSTFDGINLEYDDLLDDISVNGDFLGLVVGLTDDKKVLFAHKTYEEFLVASWLSKNWKDHKELITILFEDQFKNTRLMFDMLLAKDSPVHLAVLYRNLDMLKKHKDKIVDSKDKAGRNALHLACSWGRKHPLVKVLKKDEKIISDKNKNKTSEENYEYFKESILHAACFNENFSNVMQYFTNVKSVNEGVECVRNLPHRLNNTPSNNPNIITIKGDSIVKIYEEDKEYLDVLEFLLKSQCNVLELDDLFKWNTFQYADKTFSLAAINLVLNYSKKNVLHYLNNFTHTASLVHYSVVFLYENLLKIVTDIPYIEYRYSYGTVTLLQLASEVNNLKAMTKLLQNQFYKDVINNETAFGGSPLFSACFVGNLEMIELLLKNGANINDFSVIYATVGSNNFECCQKLLEKGADVNKTSFDGNSALMMSTILKQQNFVELLLENGADINFVFKDMTPLQIVASCNSVHLVELLLQFKPDINHQCENLGYTALHYACAFSCVKVTQLLLKHGADTKIKSKSNLCLPLHVALLHKNKEIALELILADPNVVNEYALEENGDKLTPMLLAAQNDYPDVIQVLSQLGADLHIEGNYVNPLHVAASHGFDSSVFALIEAGASVNYPNKDGIVPLVSALDCSSTRKILLDNSADVNTKCYCGLTVLHYATLRENLDAIQELVKKGAHIDDQDSAGDTPLVYSIRKKHIEIVNYLLDCGANIGEGSKLLFLATINDFPECISSLVEKGIKVTSKHQNEVSALYQAVLYENRCIKVLLEFGADPNISMDFGNSNNLNFKTVSVLHLAAIKRDLFSIVLLTNSGANVNITTATGLTPLHLLCSQLFSPDEVKNLSLVDGIYDEVYIHYNNYDCAKELISRGADLNARGQNDITPLHLACNYNYTKIIKLLLESGADVNAETLSKQTPLHCCMAIEKMENARLLLENGASLDVTDNFGKKPIDYALDKIGSKEMKTLQVTELENLLSLGADLNSTVKSNGTTLLHLASEVGNLHVVEYLIKSGADVESKTTDKNITPLILACANNHKEVVSLLLNKKANPNIQTTEGTTPLHCAILNGNKDIIELLLNFEANVNMKNVIGITALPICIKMYSLYKSTLNETNPQELLTSKLM